MRDSAGRMSPITSAPADDHFGSYQTGSHAAREADSSSRVLQLEQQLRDSVAVESRLKRQLDEAKVSVLPPSAGKRASCSSLQAEISTLKRSYDERLETMRSEERRQQDQISRLKVQLEECRKSEEEARLRTRR
jgi:predicted RNase H-like nuclease (RuvC/YqgF family)